eukprot:TRINITY_DN11592_c0_g2_i1.p3 TRINITY_DN11592_c0_g2~~TRINITY_DN11592_c0_g2_i1.p3  ORF type:complete len:150 (+),score=4.92 TRINITY_DN11592_c0_g2_i1:92-541(+)
MSYTERFILVVLMIINYIGKIEMIVDEIDLEEMDISALFQDDEGVILYGEYEEMLQILHLHDSPFLAPRPEEIISYNIPKTNTDEHVGPILEDLTQVVAASLVQYPSNLPPTNEPSDLVTQQDQEPSWTASPTFQSLLVKLDRISLRSI